MSTIEIKSGNEGPRHDPYHFEEVIVHRTSSDFTGTITRHSGLGTWVRVEEPGKVPQMFNNDDADAWFEVYAGISVRAAVRAKAQVGLRRLRYHPCGERSLDWVSGMPGEDLLWCSKCKTVLSSRFDVSAVE